ncbi:MAG: RNA polymerase sporulation sigma factor SigE [Christensenellales bacterium]|jgi:RNA polymerase sporulation-specific sigma factor
MVLWMEQIWEKIRQWLGRDEVEGVYYIGGSQPLPPPLPADQERQVIARLAQGDQSARAVLIERNLRLVVYIAKKFDNTGVNIEDLISIGTIGLIKAVNTFDPSKKIKLATYASRCIENEILMHLRRSVKLKAEVSLEEPLNVDWDGNELLLEDILGTEGDVVTKTLDDEVDKTLLMEAMEQLSDRERRIIRLRFGLSGENERTQKEVADQMGISQSYISRLEKRIIRQLRDQMRSLQ